MGGTTTATTPAPTDYTAAMINASNNQSATQMAQIGAQIIGLQLMSANQSDQTAVRLETALDRNDVKLEIATMNFDLAKLSEENRHDEAKDALEVAKIEAARPETVDAETLTAPA